ncbi:MAG: hypothetical protein ABJC12_00085 [Saprospiraceae bacterium]
MTEKKQKKKIPSPVKASGIRSKVRFDYSVTTKKYVGPLGFGVIVTGLLLVFSIFKNISHPLFWADESMTAMGSERVIHYGYPKVHDGKNVFYDLRHSNPTLGINEKNDAYVGGAGWLQYYFGIIGYKLAATSDDLFTKTGIYRSTFATAGLLGLFLFGFLISRLFADQFSRYAFLFLYFLLELFSVSLALLLREVRYYSLVMLLTSIILGMYSLYRFRGSFNKIGFTVSVSIALWLLFNTFAPVYFILAASIGASELIMVIGQGIKSNLKKSILEALPVIIALLISFMAIIPLMSYFRTFEISKAMSDFNNYNNEIYKTNLATVFNYFKNFELLWLMLLLKILMATQFRSILKEKSPAFKTSCFLTLVFILFVFAISKIPNFIYTRYIIYMQPVLVAIILIDFFTVIRQFTKGSEKMWPIKLWIPVAAFICGFFLMVLENFNYISGHVYELTHIYKGPLDYTIPYLKEKYPQSDSLVIAANYEETSYMYYLNSKVIMGFAGNNLQQDSIKQPDVIAYRKTWGNNASIYNKFLSMAPFEPEKFPIKDNPVNNIPELNFRPAFNHQFRTLLPADEKDATYLYIKK